MEIKLQSLLSAVPIGVVAIGAIMSYGSLQAQASENAEDIASINEQVDDIEDDVNELQRQASKTEVQLDNAVQDIDIIRGDTKQILQLLQRRPTQ